MIAILISSLRIKGLVVKLQPRARSRTTVERQCRAQHAVTTLSRAREADHGAESWGCHHALAGAGNPLPCPVPPPSPSPSRTRPLPCRPGVAAWQRRQAQPGLPPRTSREPVQWSVTVACRARPSPWNCSGCAPVILRKATADRGNQRVMLLLRTCLQIGSPLLRCADGGLHYTAARLLWSWRCEAALCIALLAKPGARFAPSMF